jgi:glycosyltransferase involved in cell wall biosynthesis
VSIDLVLGQPALFRIISEESAFEDFSTRERRLLVGALNFHALMAPERELTAHFYGGGWQSLPRTTDDSTFTGMSRLYARREFTARMVSAVPLEDREPIAAEARSRRLTVGNVRHLHISRDAVLQHDPPRDISSAPVRRVLRRIRAKTPLLYDEARDLELLRHRRALVKRAPRRDYAAEFEVGGIHGDSRIVPAREPVAGAQRAVLLGLHWFELGGAERWAFETVRMVREAGLLPIVLTNRDSHQPWIARPELEGALLLPFSEATALSQTSGVEEVLRAIFRTFDVRGVVVHHNQWLYDRLHWIRWSRPELPIVDSTHIVEYRGGGYPVSSALVEEAITTHHVISPALERWMTDVQGIPQSKVKMAPLGGLTVDIPNPVFRARRADEPFTVAFIGRIARQKAPEVFVSMARRLQKKASGIRFVMHGDGDMSSVIDDMIRAQGVAVERRDSTVPVPTTLSEAHVLVVPSHNEGLTLTTLEALAYGVPVVSTDVGAQRDIVPPRALTPRNAHVATQRLAAIVEALRSDEAARRMLWEEEHAAERRLLAAPSASQWFQEEVRGW